MASRLLTQLAERIAATREGDRLVLTISDDAAPAPPAAKPPGLGIGLSNIRQRLANRYGEAAEVIAGRTSDGFVNRISLPLVLDHPVLSASSAAA